MIRDNVKDWESLTGSTTVCSICSACLMPLYAWLMVSMTFVVVYTLLAETNDLYCLWIQLLPAAFNATII